MSEQDDGIREAAIAFVRARRAKLTVRQQRNDLLQQHSIECDFETQDPCYRQTDRVVRDMLVEYEPIPEDEWCEHCRKAQPLHDEYQRLVRVAAGAIRRLEHRVNKAAP